MAIFEAPVEKGRMRHCFMQLGIDRKLCVLALCDNVMYMQHLMRFYKDIHANDMLVCQQTLVGFEQVFTGFTRLRSPRTDVINLNYFSYI